MQSFDRSIQDGALKYLQPLHLPVRQMLTKTNDNQDLPIHHNETDTTVSQTLRHQQVEVEQHLNHVEGPRPNHLERPLQLKPCPHPEYPRLHPSLNQEQFVLQEDVVRRMLDHPPENP